MDNISLTIFVIGIAIAVTILAVEIHRLNERIKKIEEDCK